MLDVRNAYRRRDDVLENASIESPAATGGEVIAGAPDDLVCRFAPRTLPSERPVSEQRVDLIIETSPNGIVILDDRLRILHMNPAFCRYCMRSDAVCGQSISCLMDPEPFERLVAEQKEQLEVTVDHKSCYVVCHEILYRMPEEDQIVGILVNVTKSRANEQELSWLRAQTVMQALELLEQQMRMAETIAACLGENTARGDALLHQLVQMAGEQGAQR